MSSNTRKKTATATATTTPATARARATAPLRRKSSGAATSAAQLTSQRIASDLAAFKKAGGRIEVLGNTPLRPYSSRTASRKTAATPAAKAAKKS